MKRILFSVFTLIGVFTSFGLVSPVSADIFEGFFKAEEAYYEGACPGGKRWSFFVGATLHEICCPLGQLPTGNIDPRQATCARPGPIRGACGPNAQPTVCTGSSPFQICCPLNQNALCEPDIRLQQCAFNPLDQIVDAVESVQE
jgi:hypothetical protein